MKKCCIGLLAHVDAGKTTLAEAMLYRSGLLKNPGRVDYGSTAMDTHELEKKRGITIFSSQAVFVYDQIEFTLLDTPGHLDFSSEMERALKVLDCAILVISGTDGVQAHTETLWRLLEQYSVPVILFVTKMDMIHADRQKLMQQLKKRLCTGVFDFSEIPDDEELAFSSEEALAVYEENKHFAAEDISELIRQRLLFPCFFGSGLHVDGIDAFLDGLSRYAPIPTSYPTEFGAKVYKITHSAQGGRLTHLKLTGGRLKVRDVVHYLLPDGTAIEEKITGIRVFYSGSRFEAVQEAEAGKICAVSGLTSTFAGQGLGFERDNLHAEILPALSYGIRLPPGTDDKVVLPKLKQLEEEDPLLCFLWNSKIKEIQLRIMGKVQIEVLENLIHDRFGYDVRISSGRIDYKETISNSVEGAGHYEPLKHYAEVHLLLEPLEPGSGLEFESDCPTDSLDLNWQRLILTHLAEKRHVGVLTGSELTDVRFTLIAGRAHLKHTEGGDFREATYRAVRQGLMKAESVLLEPWYRFRLEVPIAQTGRAISDMRMMHARFETESGETSSLIHGTVPVSTISEYETAVAAYTSGRGKLSCILEGYKPCHNAAEVIASIGYHPESDLENSPDSIFCAHGAGFQVKWDQVDRYCHIDTGRNRFTEDQPPRPRMKNISIDEKELEAIMLKEFGPIRRPVYSRTEFRAEVGPTDIQIRRKKELVIIDGYNVIFAWDELKSLSAENLSAARGRLIDILLNYHSFTSNDVVLVFDGYAVPDNDGEKHSVGGIKVVYTKQNESADLYIERMLSQIGKNDAVRVVTSDNLIRLSAIGSGIHRTSSREFGNEIDWVMERISEILKKSTAGEHRVSITEAGAL